MSLAKAKTGLKRLVDSGELSQAEYDQIIDALDEPTRSQYRDRVVLYRNRLGHRISASVDYPEVFTDMQNRVGIPLLDAAGNIKGTQFTIYARSSKPEFQFSEIFDALTDYLLHIIEMLNRLKNIPRLA